MVDENGGDGGLIACAMRIVNAIGAVCGARPGLLDALDLPFTVGRNVVGARLAHS
jgi:4-hydroxy-tetrahydrodipicolinate reductase